MTLATPEPLSVKTKYASAVMAAKQNTSGITHRRNWRSRMRSLSRPSMGRDSPPGFMFFPSLNAARFNPRVGSSLEAHSHDGILA